MTVSWTPNGRVSVSTKTCNKSYNYFHSWSRWVYLSKIFPLGPLGFISANSPVGFIFPFGPVGFFSSKFPSWARWVICYKGENWNPDARYRTEKIQFHSALLQNQVLLAWRKPRGTGGAGLEWAGAGCIWVWAFVHLVRLPPRHCSTWKQKRPLSLFNTTGNLVSKIILGIDWAKVQQIQTWE